MAAEFVSKPTAVPLRLFRRVQSTYTLPKESCVELHWSRAAAALLWLGSAGTKGAIGAPCVNTCLYVRLALPQSAAVVAVPTWTTGAYGMWIIGLQGMGIPRRRDRRDPERGEALVCTSAEGLGGSYKAGRLTAHQPFTTAPQPLVTAPLRPSLAPSPGRFNSQEEISFIQKGHTQVAAGLHGLLSSLCCCRPGTLFLA